MNSVSGRLNLEDDAVTFKALEVEEGIEEEQDKEQEKEDQDEGSLSRQTSSLSGQEPQIIISPSEAHFSPQLSTTLAALIIPQSRTITRKKSKYSHNLPEDIGRADINRDEERREEIVVGDQGRSGVGGKREVRVVFGGREMAVQRWRRIRKIFYGNKRRLIYDDWVLSFLGRSMSLSQKQTVLSQKRKLARSNRYFINPSTPFKRILTSLLLLCSLFDIFIISY